MTGPVLRPLRHTWADLPDDGLLDQCVVDTFRASGPGGQKRNKTSSAVRLRHVPSGLSAIAVESRSQHENKAKALRRLRQEFYLTYRDAIDPATVRTHPDYAAEADGKIHLREKDARFWPTVGVVLDVLDAVGAQVSTAAEMLGTTTANLIDLLQLHPQVWQTTNQLRAKFGLNPLKWSGG
jgi:RF-1 domain